VEAFRHRIALCYFAAFAPIRLCSGQGLAVKAVMPSVIIQYDSTVAAIGDFDALPQKVKYALDNALSYTPSGTKYMRSVRYGRWDGRVRLLTPKGRFAPGLCQVAKEALEKLDYEVKVQPVGGAAQKGEPLRKIKFTGKLYPFQQQALKAVLNSETPHGIIHSPPRSGKTVMAAALIAKLGYGPVLFLCERLDIAEQTKRVFEKFLATAEIGCIMDGRVIEAPIVVCTIQSALSALRFSGKYKKTERDLPESDKARAAELIIRSRLVIIDEAHHAASPSYRQVCRKLKNKSRIIGLSGTPYRDDAKTLLMHAVCGPIVYSISIEELQALGLLVPTEAIFLDLPAPQKYRARTYAEEYRELVVENELRNQVICNAARKLSRAGRTCLILTKHVKHARLLSALLPEAEVLVASGEMKADVAKRAATWEDLRSETQPIVITTLADEGIDIPSLSAVIIAGAGASKVKTLQRLRCMTSAPGKARALVLDFLDHGAHLRKHSLQRIASLKAAGLEVKTRRAEEIAGD